MSDKAQTVIDAAKSQLGNPYVYGTWGQECTPALRKRYAGYNPSHKDAIYKKCPVLSGTQSTCDGCKWQGKLAFDCRGFTYWCLKQAGITISGSGATSQYDTAANWSEKGEISNMPDCVCCVFQRKNSRMQHTGLHIGGGMIIHCSAGVQTGNTADTAWTHYAVPAGLYEETPSEPLTVYRNLKKGSTGEDVKALQERLNELGYDCGDADGIFGTKTRAAVMQYQLEAGLTVDGIAGKETQSALFAESAGAVYTVTLKCVPEAEATELCAKYAGSMEREGGDTHGVD
jgi:cell wall-associated NlpC family hydrolase